MSEYVKNLFTDISPTYDRLNHLLSFNIDKSWRKKTIGKINQAKDSDFLALDICAGTHDMGLELHRQFPNALLVASDFSEGMLNAGQAKIAPLEEKGLATTVCADALNLPFADSIFNTTFCAYGVRNFDDTKQGMQEMFRVLKPGGQALVLEFFKPTKGLNKFFNKTYAQHVLPRVGQLISGNKQAYSYLRDSIRGFLTIEEMTQLMQDIGFVEIETKSFFMGISTCISAKKP